MSIPSLYRSVIITVSFAENFCVPLVLLDPGTYRYFDGIMSLDYQVPRSIKGLYSTDVVANRSLEFLEDAITAGKPFFLGVTPVGPHANTDEKGFTNPIPADRHKLLFPDVQAPRTPNFNPSTVRKHDPLINTGVPK